MWHPCSVCLVLGTCFLFPRKGHISPISGVFPGLLISWRAPKSSPGWVLPMQVRGSGLRAGAVVSWGSLPLPPPGGLIAVVSEM